MRLICWLFWSRGRECAETEKRVRERVWVVEIYGGWNIKFILHSVNNIYLYRHHHLDRFHTEERSCEKKKLVEASLRKLRSLRRTLGVLFLLRRRKRPKLGRICRQSTSCESLMRLIKPFFSRSPPRAACENENVRVEKLHFSEIPLLSLKFSPFSCYTFYHRRRARLVSSSLSLLLEGVYL